MTKIKLSKREMMVEAHKMAKKMVGNYIARLALALRTLWVAAKKGVTKSMKAIENLTGSEKQIAWATEIVTTNLNALQRELTYMNEREARGNGSFPEVTAKLEKAIRELEESSYTAKWWIEHQGVARAYIQKIMRG